MPTRYPQEAVLRDGRRLLVRPFTENDVDSLYEFFLHLPQEVRRFAWDRIDAASAALAAPGIPTLLGIEGAAALVYFRNFSGMIKGTEDNDDIPGLEESVEKRVGDAQKCLRACTVRLRDQPVWWFQGRELFEALAVRLDVALADAGSAERRFVQALRLAEASDQYGAAWLVAEVAGPLAGIGVRTALAQISRFAALVAELDYSTLTARYLSLHDQAGP